MEFQRNSGRIISRSIVRNLEEQVFESQDTQEAIASYAVAVREMAKQNEDLQRLKQAKELDRDFVEWLCTSFDSVYNHTEERLPYVLIFQDCHDIRWIVHNSKEVHEPEADLIGFSIGAESHQEAAVITTDIFELFIIYGSFVLQKNW